MIEEQIVKIPTPEQYYNKTDSAYLRIEFISGMGFRVTLRNEMLLSEDGNTSDGEFVGAIARGLLEIAYMSGEEVYKTGIRAAYMELLEASGGNLNEEQLKIWQEIKPGSIH